MTWSPAGDQDERQRRGEMGRPPKFDDDEILDRAVTAFWEDGWSQTSIRDLERALDLKAPSIYRRFGTKHGLAVAVLDHYVDRVVRRRVDKYLSGEGDPVANVRIFLERSVTQSESGGRLWGCLLTTTSLEGGALDGAARASLDRGLTLIEDGLRREVTRAARLDRLAPDVDPDEAVAMLTLVMQGLMSLSRGGVPPSELRSRAQAAVSTIVAAER